MLYFNRCSSSDMVHPLLSRYEWSWNPKEKWKNIKTLNQNIIIFQDYFTAYTSIVYFLFTEKLNDGIDTTTDDEEYDQNLIVERIDMGHISRSQSCSG